MSINLPTWAEEMADLFRSGSVAQFLIHGNIFDVIPAAAAKGKPENIYSLREFLNEVMFAQYDVVLHYDRGRGIVASKGGEVWSEWLDSLGGEAAQLRAGMREPAKALELMDRFILRTLNLKALTTGKMIKETVPTNIALVVSFAEFVVPRGDALSLGGAFAGNVVKVLGWANDPAVMQANIATVLISEGLGDLNQLVTENPHAAKLHIPLPDESAMRSYIETLARGPLKDLEAKCEVDLPTLAQRLTGLSRVEARRVVATALNSEGTLTAKFLTAMKKELIERECQNLLEFMESDWSLDMVAGHSAAKSWLREDAKLLHRNVVRALPMGYLIAGRIGTGKTFLVKCWAGELGIPCVVLKNFRDKWVGATEGNLEKIFSILRALGQVVVFVDEADQFAGKRGGGNDDSGLSGRIYSMLAQEMSDTNNRGRILWVFATSRPDMLEVDLKRQGRLDVHIPLFAPQNKEETAELLSAIARKLKMPLKPEDLPDLPALPEGQVLGGNELEGVLVRALRVYELADDPKPPLKKILGQCLAEVRPSAHTLKLEYMDLVAVKECTDARFLPESFAQMPAETLEGRLSALRSYM